MRLIRTEAELVALVERLRSEPLLAVDTEAASFHRYLDRVYLLQISSREETAVVDPLATGGLGPLGELLADPAIEIVFHDADYDLRLLEPRVRVHGEASVRHPHRRAAPERARRRARRAAGEVSRHPTRQTVPARRLVGATALARDARVRGVGHPLPAAAAGPPPAAARGAGTARLGAGGVRATGGHPSDTPGPGRAGLAPGQRGEGAAREGTRHLRELWEWRDGAARRADRATFRILNNEPMLAMAKNPPTELTALKAIPGVSARPGGAARSRSSCRGAARS